MICLVCAESIEAAGKFYKQVKSAEELYKNYFVQKQGVDDELHLEESLFIYPNSDDIGDNEASALMDGKIINNSLNSYDSDTPIANQMSKENNCIGNLNGQQGDIFPLSQITKQVSERKRVKLTCETVLTETTACPFRHHKSWFQCFFCFKDFMELKLLRDHYINVHANAEEELKKIKRFPRSLQIDISNLECRKCQMDLTDVENMIAHFDSVHQKRIYKECIADYKVNSSPYCCHICEKEFHVFRTLTTHLNEHYANCICDVCGKSFLNSKRLKVHKRTHESGAYPCNQCGKVLRTKTSKANHIESAHSKRTIKCHICDKPMKHYNDRIKHMSEVHNITHTFKCPICGRVYNIKHYLATHIRQTHGSKNKKCTECSMSFITNHGLKKHMLKHSGERPFSCNVCFKSYTRNYTLREHMREHDKSDC
ncbi:zinc finger protein 665-like isoform X2 [Zerene cesonia]|nr:zinc finger protein 665-like isoform X2 [Zerene cesonia]